MSQRFWLFLLGFYSRKLGRWSDDPIWQKRWQEPRWFVWVFQLGWNHKPFDALQVDFEGSGFGFFSENPNMPQNYWSQSTFCYLHQTPVRCWPVVSAKVYLVTNVGGLVSHDTFLQQIPFRQIASPRPAPRNWTKSEFQGNCDHCNDFFSQKFAMTYQLGDFFEHEASLQSMAFVSDACVLCHRNVCFLPFQFPVLNPGSVHWMYPSQVIYHWTGGFEVST